MHHTVYGEDARVWATVWPDVEWARSKVWAVGRVTPSESRRRSNVRLFKTVRRPPGAESTTNDQCCLVCRWVYSDTVIRVYIRTFQCLFSFTNSKLHTSLKWLTVVWKEISPSSLVTFLSSTLNSPASGRGLTPKWGRWRKKWANSDQNSWTERATTSSKAQLGIY